MNDYTKCAICKNRNEFGGCKVTACSFRPYESETTNYTATECKQSDTVKEFGIEEEIMGKKWFVDLDGDVLSVAEAIEVASEALSIIKQGASEAKEAIDKAEGQIKIWGDISRIRRVALQIFAKEMIESGHCPFDCNICDMSCGTGKVVDAYLCSRRLIDIYSQRAMDELKTWVNLTEGEEYKYIPAPKDAE